ncbi:TolC family outer membrane protein [Hyphomicrobium sp.]|uniref:TolC family outer membrane protein n=1 Tax=Hyphomicrobium sp. TaxID=82 RepID=UPI000FA9242C|nr:TolC family outer membrane protein [Hyphomicrobium sp.]RUO97942.1 MAG: channel protein TolC [Hyphomicrobium sp.]
MAQTTIKISSCLAATIVGRRALAAVVAIAVGSAVSVGAEAETLLDTLAATYQYSPTLDAARAQQRAVDENVARANSGYRPNAQFGANVGRQRVGTFTNNASGHTVNSPRGYSFDITQPLFTGFQVTNAVNSAEASDRAGRETLRSTEQQVLLDAVTAYGDVTRDQAIVKLNENNLKFLDAELKAQRDRFAVGEVTKTDVAQSEARRALGQSDLDQARANLKSSRAIFEQVVGHPPSNLVEANPNTRLVPRSLEDAVAIGTKENPIVVNALYSEQAARYNVDQIRGQLLPQAQLQGNYSDQYDPSEGIDRGTTASIVASVTVPLYANGGEVFAQVRQAKHQHVAALQQIEVQRAAAQSQVVQAWSQLVGFKAQAESDKASIVANTTALNGVREEERVGQRTVLDVLNAQQELLQSQVNLETTKRNILVASYTLVSAIGRLSVSEVGAATAVYDPQVHYQQVRNKWWGIDITHGDGRQEHMDVTPVK